MFLQDSLVLVRTVKLYLTMLTLDTTAVEETPRLLVFRNLFLSLHDNLFQTRECLHFDVYTRMVAGAYGAHMPLRLGAALLQNEAFDRYLLSGQVGQLLSQTPRQCLLQPT